MKITRNVEKKLNKDSQNETQKRSKEQTVEVLYQRMGDRWYAFSLIDDEVFIGSISVQDLNSPQDRSLRKSI